MRTYTHFDQALRANEQRFSIIEEFAALQPARKVLLCDHLFIQGRAIFQRTVQLLWPEAQAKDMVKLEKFLFLLKQTAH